MKYPSPGEFEYQEKWPKILPELTSEQIQIKNEWMKYWHEVLPKKYSAIEKFNHGFSVNGINKGKEKKQYIETLDIGAGLGEHIAYENLDNQHYSILELRENMANVLKERFPSVNTVVGDIQKQTIFNDMQFDRVIAIHVLEHLPDLPCALKEIHRVLKSNGSFTAVIPCEGGLAYTLARAISAKRLFEKKFKMKYDWLIKTEHINKPHEIIEEIEKQFTVCEKKYFPFALPFVFCNLCIALSMTKKQ